MCSVEPLTSVVVSVGRVCVVCSFQRKRHGSKMIACQLTCVLALAFEINVARLVFAGIVQRDPGVFFVFFCEMAKS